MVQAGKGGVLLFFATTLLFLFLTSCSPHRPEPREVWISNILANPQDFWQKPIKIIGTVQDIQVEPKGTKQGYYQLMDSNQEVIDVKSNDLPNVGGHVVVVGVVGQSKENAMKPLVIETERQWVWTSFIFIFLGIVCMIATMVFIIIKFFRGAAVEQSEAGQETLNGSGRILPAHVKQKKMRRKAEPQPPSKQYAETTFIDSRVLESLEGPVNKSVTVQLEVIAGPDKGKKFHFTRSNISIGRSGRRLNDIELNDVTISREQARLELNRSGAGHVLKNEGTTNPTLINGQPLAVAKLKHGDEILVGTTLLQYKIIE